MSEDDQREWEMESGWINPETARGTLSLSGVRWINMKTTIIKSFETMCFLFLSHFEPFVGWDGIYFGYWCHHRSKDYFPTALLGLILHGTARVYSSK